jgi:hypothetical protein
LVAALATAFNEVVAVAPVLAKTVVRKVIASRIARTHARSFAATMVEMVTTHECPECFGLIGLALSALIVRASATPLSEARI